MDIHFFLRGVIIGFAIAAPVGPIGVLCIRRTLAEGPASGLVSGLGAASADAIYGWIAAFGLTVVSTLLVDYQDWLRLGGGGFLLYLGLHTFFARPTPQVVSATGTGLIGAYTSTFFLTLTNPMTILSFGAIFAGLGLASATARYDTAVVLVLGVFVGSALWWLLLSGGFNLVRTKITLAQLAWVNRASGVIIAGFGLWYGWSVLQNVILPR